MGQQTVRLVFSLVHRALAITKAGKGSTLYRNRNKLDCWELDIPEKVRKNKTKKPKINHPLFYSTDGGRAVTNGKMKSYKHDSPLYTFSFFSLFINMLLNIIMTLTC